MASFWQSGELWLMVGTILLLMVGLFMLFTGQTSLPQTVTKGTESTHPSYLRWTPESPPDSLLALPVIWRRPLEYEDPPPQESIRPAIIIEEPACYALANGHYSCLGRLWNDRDDAIGDTGFDFAFYDSNRREIARSATVSAQRITRPGGFSPYRVMMSDRDFTVFEAHPERVSVEISNIFEPLESVHVLRVIDSNGSLTENGQYQVSMTVENDSDVIIDSMRVTTTLSSSQWGIVGYNIHEVGENTVIRDNTTLKVEIIPYTLPDDITHTIHVEGIAKDD